MANVAAVTMVYNETRKMKRWFSYYSGQLGEANCFVVDHGTDDGSTAFIPQGQIVKIPRSPQDNIRRADAISYFVQFLLKYYDAAFYTDCDEIVVADPNEYSGLRDYCDKTSLDCVYSLGLDVVQKIGSEPMLSDADLITRQRKHLHYSAAMCKPNFTKVPVRWARGFHSNEHRPIFNGLYNFHLRYADVEEGVSRLQTTRNIDWANSNEGFHHRVPDEQYRNMVESWGKLPVSDEDISPSMPGKTAEYTKGFVEAAKTREGQSYYDVDMSTFGRELFKLPERFVGMF